MKRGQKGYLLLANNAKNKNKMKKRKKKVC